MAKRNGGDPVTNTANRPRMNMEAYQLGAVRQPERGKLVRKTGNAKGGSEPATANSRGQIMQATLGASYRVTAKRTPYNMTDPQAPTQANGRIVPSVSGSKRNFRANW